MVLYNTDPTQQRTVTLLQKGAVKAQWQGVQVVEKRLAGRQSNSKYWWQCYQMFVTLDFKPCKRFS